MSILLVASTNQSTTAGNATTQPFGQTYMGVVNNTTESFYQTTWRTAGAFNKLYTRVSSNAATGSATVTFRKNTNDGNQSISVAAGATGEFFDNLQIDSVVSGDLVNFKWLAGTGGATTKTLVTILFTQASGSNVERLVLAGSLNSNNNGTTAFYAIAGQCNGGTGNPNEARVQLRIRGVSGTLQNLGANVSANARTTGTTVVTRKNTVNGNQLLSIAAGATGVFEDNVNTDSVVPGDQINYAITYGAEATSLVFRIIEVELASSNYYFVNAQNAALAFNSATTNFFSLSGGNSSSSSTTESDFQTLIQVPMNVSNLSAIIGGNTLNGATTLGFRSNGNNGQQLISISAATTGNFEDTTNIDKLVGTEEVDYQFAVGGSSGTISLLGLSSMSSPSSVPQFFSIPNQHQRVRRTIIISD